MKHGEALPLKHGMLVELADSTDLQGTLLLLHKLLLLSLLQLFHPLLVVHQSLVLLQDL